MKKFVFLIFLGVLLFSCEKSGKECMNEPPSFGVVIVKNEVPDNRYFDGIKTAKKEAVLYKISGNEKVKIEYLKVHNDNIYIYRREGVKTFFTNNLETFYVEYKGKTDTLQVKGRYYETESCGDWGNLVELHFNGKEIDLKKNMIRGRFYKIDNFTNIEE